MRYLKMYAFIVFFLCMLCSSIYSVAQTDALKDIQNKAAALLQKDFHDDEFAALEDKGNLKAKIEYLKQALGQLANGQLTKEILEKVMTSFPKFSEAERKTLASIDKTIGEETRALYQEIQQYEKGETVRVTAPANAAPPLGNPQNNATTTTEQVAKGPNIENDNGAPILLVDSIKKLNDTIKRKNEIIAELLKKGGGDIHGPRDDGFFNLIIAGILIAAIIGLLLSRMTATKKYVKLIAAYNNLADEWQKKSSDMQLDENDRNSANPPQQAQPPLQAVSGSTGGNKLHTSTIAPAPKFFTNNTPPKGKYFFGEAMVTAGPRKNFIADAKEGDYGLGEDAAGFIIQHDKAFFWILDGTSDSDSLSKPLITAGSRQEEYFSSRLLAQSISWHMQAIINKTLPGRFNAETILNQAIGETEKEWRANIEQLDEDSRQVLLDMLGQKNILQCSTTVIFGILTLNGTLDICRVGDSKIIAYPGKHDFAKSTGRQFANIQQDGSGIVLSFNSLDDARKQNIQLNNIKTILAMTDGISGQMETWLKNFDAINFADHKTRETFAHFKQNTYDDKALCILQIKE